MRAFKFGPNETALWFCYDEPKIHFVEVTDTAKKQHFFELPFPGIGIAAASMGGKISSMWPSVWILPKGCPILKDGTISKRAEFNVVPLGHCYNYASVCIYNKVPRPNIQTVFAEFWQSTSTYFVEGHVASWCLEKGYAKDLVGRDNHWQYFKGMSFFEDWEKNYTLDTIAKAPFMKFPATVLRGRTVDVQHSVGAWKEVEIPEMLVNENVQPVAIAAP